jgi:hypothetical protein
MAKKLRIEYLGAIYPKGKKQPRPILAGAVC